MAKFASAFLVTLIGCAVMHVQNVITNYAPGTDFQNIGPTNGYRSSALASPTRSLTQRSSSR
jgi:hypothetical protein